MNLVCPGRSSGWPCFSSQRWRLCRRRRLDLRFDKRDSCNWTPRCSCWWSRRARAASRPVPRVDRCRGRCSTTRSTKARSSRNRRPTWCSCVARPRWWSRPRHRDNRDPSPGCRIGNEASPGGRTSRGNSGGQVSWRNRSSRRRRTGVADRLCQFQVCLAGNSLSESWSSTGRNRMSPPGWPSMSCARSDASPQFLQRWISSLLETMFFQLLDRVDQMDRPLFFFSFFYADEPLRSSFRIKVYLAFVYSKRDELWWTAFSFIEIILSWIFFRSLFTCLEKGYRKFSSIVWYLIIFVSKRKED